MKKSTQSILSCDSVDLGDFAMVNMSYNSANVLSDSDPENHQQTKGSCIL